MITTCMKFKYLYLVSNRDIYAYNIKIINFNFRNYLQSTFFTNIILRV